MMNIKRFSLLLAAAISGSAFLLTRRADAPPSDVKTAEYAPLPDPSNPVELGAVRWSRDLDAGFAAAQKSGKPLLILFQEVPGCSNCTRYGSQTLRHPLIVEAIETFFEPVCIYNNKGGKDGEALKRFGEPAWNNPVVRIVDVAGKDLVPRMSDFNSTWQLTAGLKKALASKGQTPPAYLDLLEEEIFARESGLETATFSMYCFWSGESVFGAIPGVIETEPGFQDGHEVVRVVYNPAVVSRRELEQKTTPKGIKTCSGNNGFRADREPKYYLAQTHYRAVPMSALQACRANSLAGEGKSPESVLSPRQIALARKISSLPESKWKNAIGQKDLAKAWEDAAMQNSK